MSLRGGAGEEALERRGNLVAIQIGLALATRLLRCAMTLFLFVFQSNFPLPNTYGYKRARAK